MRIPDELETTVQSIGLNVIFHSLLLLNMNESNKLDHIRIYILRNVEVY